jgi:hypothetical protein
MTTTALERAGRQARFWRFARHVTIPSKDRGPMVFRPFGTQRFLIEEVLRALGQGKRHIVVLKARQIGATTAFVTFDAYWLLSHPGMQGSFIANTDENLHYFRDVLGELVKGLPARYAYPVRLSNRVQVAWSNGSRLLYQTAGSKSKGKLGRGRGLNFLHGTEVAFWGDADGVQALRAALSDTHRHAAYLWESTANGFNHFYDMWQEAQRAVTMHAVFVPWWRHELYCINAEGSRKEKAITRVYWDGGLTAEEQAWQREILRRWSVELTPGQWTWRRWYLSEKASSNVQVMHAEYPTLPEHAFQATGSNYLQAATLTQLRSSLAQAPMPEHYRYQFGPTVEATEVVPTRAGLGDLQIWEEPQATGGHYVVAADPAFGANALSDRMVVQVWRATRSRLIQVAEFASNEPSMTQFAWIIMHLGGVYTRAYLALEINGPGIGVLQEIQRMLQWGWGASNRAKILDAFGAIQHYIYHRADSMRSSMAWQWRTTPMTKVPIMNRLRAQLMHQALVVRSAELVEELGNVRQVGNTFGTEGRAHDDRVMTAAIAVEAWSEQVMPVVAMTPMGPEEGVSAEAQEATPAHTRAVQEFFARRLRMMPGGAR